MSTRPNYIYLGVPIHKLQYLALSVTKEIFVQEKFIYISQYANLLVDFFCFLCHSKKVNTHNGVKPFKIFRLRKNARRISELFKAISTRFGTFFFLKGRKK